ncbi:hypothetical protein GQ457_15G026100 [Hibiscus cannabinus]
MEIQHPIHERFWGWCSVCKELLSSPHLRTNQRSELDCSDEERSIRHFTHDHPLKPVGLDQRDGVDCAICDEPCSSSSPTYGCTECKYLVHLDCTKHLPFFDCKGHPHLLTFLDKTPGSLCHRCGVDCSSFVFGCVPCNFNVHLQCLPSAPKTITHKSHLHSLILTKSPLEHELNSDEQSYDSGDEFYCDVCEEKRCKKESVYYCADCKFIAELCQGAIFYSVISVLLLLFC